MCAAYCSLEHTALTTIQGLLVKANREIIRWQSIQSLPLSRCDIMRQVTAVCSGCIKNWSCMQGKSCWASGHRRKVPYEKFNGTRDGARARLLFLLSFSTALPCACSRRELTVLPVKVSGFLWMCVQDAVYWLSIHVRVGLGAHVHVGWLYCPDWDALLGFGCPEIALAVGHAAIKKTLFRSKNRRNKGGEGRSVNP